MNQIAKKQEGKVKGLLFSNMKSIKAALADQLDPTQFCRVALTTANKTPALAECSEESLLNAFLEAAQLQLWIDGYLGHGYIVPYGSTAQLIVGYRGMLELVRRSDEIDTAAYEVVYKGDEFDYQLGDDPFVRHRPMGESYDDEDMTHAYAVFRFKSGGKVVSVWPRKRIEAHRDRYCPSRNKKDSPWKTAPRAMWIKTVIRDMINRGMVPISVQAQKACLRDEYAEAGIVEGQVQRRPRVQVSSQSLGAANGSEQGTPRINGSEGQDAGLEYEAAINDAGSREVLADLKSQIDADESLDDKERQTLSRFAANQMEVVS